MIQVSKTNHLELNVFVSSRVVKEVDRKSFCLFTYAKSMKQLTEEPTQTAASVDEAFIEPAIAMQLRASEPAEMSTARDLAYRYRLPFVDLMPHRGSFAD
ncbi:MAG: hypothetical protein WKF84_21425 [Pyrinomonadaceae bacterium]